MNRTLKQDLKQDLKMVATAILYAMAILSISALAAAITGCVSITKTGGKMPYSYPVYAMPHGNEFHPPMVEENPILLSTPIIPQFFLNPPE